MKTNKMALLIVGLMITILGFAGCRNSNSEGNNSPLDSSPVNLVSSVGFSKVYSGIDSIGIQVRLSNVPTNFETSAVVKTISGENKVLTKAAIPFNGLVLAYPGTDIFEVATFSKIEFSNPLPDSAKVEIFDANFQPLATTQIRALTSGQRYRGDFNRDGIMNTVDIAYMLAWIQTNRSSDTTLVENKALEIYPRATGIITNLPEVPYDDFNDDGKIDTSDVAIMMAWIQVGKFRDTSLVLGRAKELYSLTSGSVVRFPGSTDPTLPDPAVVVLGNNEASMTFALIPAGSFAMGAMSTNQDERPVHTVTISTPFYMAKTEVTQIQYTCVLSGNPSNYKGPNKPVDSVSWFDAIAFCNRLSELKGLEKCYSGSGDNVQCNFTAEGFRLPTEAEFEYACRAGSTGDYFWGSTFDSTYAWLSYANDVGGKLPNAWGLFDIIGNSNEWCWDYYKSDYYSVSPAVDPRGPTTVNNRVFRGGRYNNDPSYSRSAYRGETNPSWGGTDLGFRVCRTVVQ
ncbi:MAG: SUMF1/EgtB/PvdO family nonheme iron enzyme [Candidatus Riflebacteria bacterium]|nr:SUMF1/EgtB/PvdO family nonheme iron enzyme [Candidatus Riflebacteria bacterium]